MDKVRFIISSLLDPKVLQKILDGKSTLEIQKEELEQKYGPLSQEKKDIYKEIFGVEI